MSTFLILMLTMVPVQATATDSAVTQVVHLLQEMLDKSKSDGNADREVYSKFKCYCDTNTEEKTEAITTAATDIERMEAELADRRGQNERLSQEIAHMKTSMEENVDAQSEATTLRNDENTGFISEEADLETGISQLDRAIEILAAVGADQTESTSADNEQFMAASATEAAKAGFLVKKASIKTLTSDMKEALRAASVFLDNDQRKVLTGFVQQSAPFTGNYNAQSGEIVGVLKEMSDTFKTNLKSARQQEEKALDEHTGFMAVKASEHNTTLVSSDAKKVVLGNNAAQIATTSSELSTMETQKSNDEDFLGALTDRCNTKKKEYDHRNMLRANEEAAIAQAVAILNSDASFNTFGNVAATSTGSTSFVQLSHNSHQSTRKSLSHRLLAKARSIHSLKLTRVAAALRANNPFTEVLAMIQDMVTLIDKEEADDVAKKDWCDTEQTNNGASLGNKNSEIMTLETDINTFVVSAGDSQTNIENAETGLADCRASQAQETETRTAQNAQFSTNLKNLQDAEKILTKAVEVLTKFYDWLHANNAAHHYDEKSNKDSGGGNLERIENKSVEELEAACSERPDCVAFNSAGWLKSSLAPEDEWYSWDGGSLFVKVFEQDRATAAQAFIQTDPETWGDEMEGQRGQGNSVIEMLNFIKTETTGEKTNAIDNEETAVSQYNTNMEALKTTETGLLDDISQYKLNLATTGKQLEEAREDLATTTSEKKAIEKYLAEIEPGCTFMQTNYATRASNRVTEKSSLESAVTTLKASPTFIAAVAAQEREDLGKCAGTCETEGMDHAKCQACLSGVTVSGYCVQNSGADGCGAVSATESAGALA